MGTHAGSRPQVRQCWRGAARRHRASAWGSLVSWGVELRGRSPSVHLSQLIHALHTEINTTLGSNAPQLKALRNGLLEQAF